MFLVDGPDSPTKTRKALWDIPPPFALDILFVRGTMSLRLWPNVPKFDALKKKTLSDAGRRLDEWCVSREQRRFKSLRKTWESGHRRHRDRYLDRLPKRRGKRRPLF